MASIVVDTIGQPTSVFSGLEKLKQGVINLLSSPAEDAEDTPEELSITFYEREEFADNGELLRKVMEKFWHLVQEVRDSCIYLSTCRPQFGRQIGLIIAGCWRPPPSSER